METDQRQPGILRPAPENFLSPQQVTEVNQGRRQILRGSLMAALALASKKPTAAAGIDPEASDPDILGRQPWSEKPGNGVTTRSYGQPSRYESNLQRRMISGLVPTRVKENAASFSPLQSLLGIITPSGLHYERHHHGWHDIDPRRHRLMVTESRPGLLTSLRVFTLEDLLRLPPVSRLHFIECGGNTGTEWGNPMVPTVQYSHGLLACSEFTGVPLRLLLEMCGADLRGCRFVLAEGADGAALTRTIPMPLVASGEVIVAYGQNGEMLRPENGYPLRLVVPGAQGISWVKWLRRIEVGDAPWGTRDETLHYVDQMPDGVFRQYTTVQECKSVITSPSGGQKLLSRGFYNITGLAWSGRGKIRGVDVSLDGGQNWQPARIEGPVLSKALTRFHMDWTWHGQSAQLQSRAWDETGYVQPTYGQLRAVRGTRSIYHNNAIQTWQVNGDGDVRNVQLT